jgi:hypothetical protein
MSKNTDRLFPVHDLNLSCSGNDAEMINVTFISMFLILKDEWLATAYNSSLDEM